MHVYIFCYSILVNVICQVANPGEPIIHVVNYASRGKPPSGRVDGGAEF